MQVTEGNINKLYLVLFKLVWERCCQTGNGIIGNIGALLLINRQYEEYVCYTRCCRFMDLLPVASGYNGMFIVFRVQLSVEHIWLDLTIL